MERVFGTPPTVHGAFSYALLEALTGGATEPSGQITSVGVESHLRNRVPALLAEIGQPALAPKFLTRDTPIVLVPRSWPLVDVAIAFEPSLAGAQADLLDATSAPRASRVVGDTPWRLHLPPGIYAVRVKNRTTLFEVELEAPVDLTVSAT